MLYLIGLGLNEQGISLEGISAIKKCKKIYLENYTVNFPYSIKKLEKIIHKRIIVSDRNQVESDFLIKEANNKVISLLIYGSPLFATTHISLIEECKKQKISYKIIYASSVFDALSETGLQLYKFGKVTSIAKWNNNYKSLSFLDYIIENNKINAHSLILVDIGFTSQETLLQLEEALKSKNIITDKILVCSRLGTEDCKIYYGIIDNLKSKKIKEPFCVIIPGKMHFIEEEIIRKFSI